MTFHRIGAYFIAIFIIWLVMASTVFADWPIDRNEAANLFGIPGQKSIEPAYWSNTADPAWIYSDNANTWFNISEGYTAACYLAPVQKNKLSANKQANNPKPTKYVGPAVGKGNACRIIASEFHAVDVETFTPPPVPKMSPQSAVGSQQTNPTKTPTPKVTILPTSTPTPTPILSWPKTATEAAALFGLSGEKSASASAWVRCPQEQSCWRFITDQNKPVKVKIKKGMWLEGWNRGKVGPITSAWQGLVEGATIRPQ